MIGPALELRPYQREAVAAAIEAEDAGTQRPAEVLPTGAGKTVVIAGVASAHIGRRPARGGRRVLILAHREELVRQNAKTVRRFAPDLRVGIVQADMDQTEGDVVSASVQTLRSLARLKRLRDVGLVVVDEAHHGVAPTYLKILEYFGCLGGSASAMLPTRPWAFGVTATMMRSDEAALGELWQDIVYTRSIAEMIREGWLVPPRGLRLRIPGLELGKVKRKGRGDYADGDLGKAIEGTLAPELIAKACAEHAPGKQGIAFAPTVETAHLYADAYNQLGMSAAVVSDRTEPTERRRLIRAFEDGDLQWLCNCMVFTEGTDLPMAEVIVVRPTKSKGLFIQMAGRGLRLHPGKSSALIIDPCGVSEKHSLLGSPDLFGLDGLRIPADGEVDEDPPVDGLELFDGDARTDLDEQLDRDEEVFLTGPVEAVEVDLFRGSDSMWNRTHGGIWFLHATSGKGGTDRYIIVQRSITPGCWDVIEMDAKTRGRSSWVATQVETLAYAMAYAQSNVTPGEQMTARRGARWRGAAVDPQGPQVALGERLGIVGAQMMTKGDLANAIDITFASRRIDPLVPAHARPQREQAYVGSGVGAW